MGDELKNKVRRFYEEAWNNGRFDVIEELFAEDYVDHDAVAHTGQSGRESARQFVELYRTALPDLRLEIQDQIAEDRTVVTRWVCIGTQNGPVMGIEPTGRSVQVDGISIDRFDDEGRFSEGWGTWDGIAFLRQLGVLPTP